MRLSLDFETACEVDLRKHGLDVYVRDPSFRVLMAAWAIDDEPAQVWDCTDGSAMPQRLAAALDDLDVPIHAYNAGFERQSLRFGWGRVVSPKRFRCTMIRAYQQSFMGTLGQIGQYVGLPEHLQKDKEGERLIRLFSVPQRVTKNQPYRWRDSMTDPEDWKRFLDYCRQDVEAERAILKRIDRFPSPAVEQHYYAMTEAKNDAGIPIDRQFVLNGMAMAARRKAELTVELRALTGLANPNSPMQLTKWLVERGYPFNDINKTTVKKVLADGGMTDEVTRALGIRRQVARSSPKKFDAIIDRAHSDDLMRHGFQFAGASRTNRESGRGAQPHNFPRPPAWLEDEKWLDEVTETIRRGDYDWLSLLCDEPLDAIVGTIRSSFRAPEGYEWVVCDLAAIESAVFAWLSGDKVLLDIVRSGKDPYKVFASFWFGVDYEDVEKWQRGLSKPGMLGCFGADTKVLTDSGWKAITETYTTDLVWDGVEWVRHDGCVNQGKKSVIDMFGVDVTADHLVLCDENWRPSCEVTQNGRYASQATCLATGLLPASFAKENAATISIIGVSAAVVSVNTMYTVTTSKRVRPGVVSRVRTHAIERQRTGFTYGSVIGLTETSWTGLPIVIMQSCHVAPVKGRSRIDMADEVLSAGLQMSTSSSITFSVFPVAPICRWKSTVRTMTGITNVATFVCSTGQANYEIRSRTTGSNITDSGIAQKTFGDCLRPGTCRHTRFVVSPVKANQPNRSSQTSSSVKVRTTYDLVNCGPRSRFCIMTDAGPMIVHNCCYRLGAGQTLPNGKRTGLFGYAEAMGVPLTQPQAAEAVGVWRSRFVGGVQFWYDLERAAMEACRTGQPQRVGHLTFDLMKPYLRMRLPTGRHMYYHLPRIEMKHGTWPDGTPYSREQLTYMGKNQATGRWERLEQHGGRWAEQSTQGTAREVLYVGAARAFADGYDIRMKVHDEIAALRRIGDERYSVDRLAKHMTDEIPSLPGLPLRAEGWVGPYYRK